MTEAKFTSGQWQASGGTVWAGHRCVATVERYRLAERNATANLIAAAPDMLAALQAVIRVADRQTVEFDLARAALAKATLA